jgi:hypothetical protein
MKKSVVGALMIVAGALLAGCSGLLIVHEIVGNGLITGRSAWEQLSENLLSLWPFVGVFAGLLLLVIGIIVVQIGRKRG